MDILNELFLFDFGNVHVNFAISGWLFSTIAIHLAGGVVGACLAPIVYGKPDNFGQVVKFISVMGFVGLILVLIAIPLDVYDKASGNKARRIAQANEDL